MGSRPIAVACIARAHYPTFIQYHPYRPDFLPVATVEILSDLAFNAYIQGGSST